MCVYSHFIYIESLDITTLLNAPKRIFLPQCGSRSKRIKSGLLSDAQYFGYYANVQIALTQRAWDIQTLNMPKKGLAFDWLLGNNL